MITFLGGPAEGVANGLCLRRAPLFLRVTCKGVPHVWDALDQIADNPECGEAVFVYRLVSEVTQIHLRRARPHTSGFFVAATYQFHEPQPDEDTKRGIRLWQQWATAEAEKVRALPSEGESP